MKAPASWRPGALLVAAYVAVAVATTAWAPGAMRPLFDGFGSHSGEYLWVNPPERYAEGNRTPEKANTTVRLAADGSAPGTATPPDGQVLAQLPALAVPAHPPDDSARIDVEPVDAGTLAPLPVGLRAGGNAYRVGVAYLPSEAAADDRLNVPGTVALTSAEPTTVLLYSADGGPWQRRDAATLPRGHGVTGALDALGYYLAAAEGGTEDDAGDAGGIPLVVYVVLAAALVGLAWFLLARRSRAATPAKTGKAAARSTGGPRPRPKSAKKRKRPKRPPPKRR